MKKYIFITLYFQTAISSFSQSTIFVDKDAVGANNGSSWTNAYSDLSDALNYATDGDQIWIASGTYYPGGSAPKRDTSFYIQVTNLSIYGGFSGVETDITQRAIINNETILSGDIGSEQDTSDNVYHVVVNDTNRVTSIDGISVKYGNANDDEHYYGGGIVNYGMLTLKNDSVSENFARKAGGGLYSEGPLIVDSSYFRSNGVIDRIVNDSDGGSGLWISEKSELSNSHFFENNITSFSNSNAGYSAIFAMDSLKSIGLKIYNNASRGIQFLRPGEVIIKKTLVDRNESVGIYINSGGQADSIVILQSSIVRNGYHGIELGYNAGYDVFIISSTISENGYDGIRGYSNQWGYLLNSTLVNNKESNINFFSYFLLSNNIFQNEIGVNISAGNFLSDGYNIINDNGIRQFDYRPGDIFGDPQNMIKPGSEYERFDDAIDIGVHELNDNIGDLPVHPLKYASIAVNKGSLTSVLEDFGVTVDQAGSPFIDAPDIGAFESPVTVEQISTSELKIHGFEQFVNSNVTLSRSMDGINYSEIGTFPSSQQDFLDINLEINTGYYYSANIDFGSDSLLSYTTFGRTLPELPSAPEQFTLDPASPVRINLSWKDNSSLSDSIDGFVIERSYQDENNYIDLADVPAGINFFSDASIEDAGRYYYRIYSYNEVGNSHYATANDEPLAMDTVYVKEDGIPCCYGQSWESALNSIWNGLTAAGEGNMVWVAEGTYNVGGDYGIQISKSGQKLYGGFSGNETSLDQRDPVNNRTIITAEAGSESDHTDNWERIFWIYGDSNKTLIDGFVIEGNYSSNFWKSAMEITGNADIHFNNMVFENNVAPSGAACIFQTGEGEIKITNSVFKNNFNPDINGSPNDCIIRTYLTSHNKKRSNLTIDNTSFYSNEIETDKFESAIISLRSGDLRVENSSFYDNEGGIVYTDGTSSTEIRNSSIYNNLGDSEVILGNSNLSATIVNSTISGNEGTGAYITTRLSDPPIVLNSTIVGNLKGLLAPGPVDVGNSIIALNDEDVFYYSDQGIRVNSLGNNIIGFIDESFISSSQTDLFGSLSNPLDPLLFELSDNGGLTKTHALMAQSPAVDAGGISEFRGEQILLDQRGESPVGTPDIGSYQSAFTKPLVQNPIADQEGEESIKFELDLHDDLFFDAGNDLSDYSVLLSDNSALPEWLVYDISNKTLRGTPSSADVGSYSIKVSASDEYYTISDVFELKIVGINDSPELITPIEDFGTLEDSELRFVISSEAFQDPDGDEIQFEIEMSDGFDFPEWLTFSKSDSLLHGIPGNSDVGKYGLKVVASDAEFSVFDQFTLTVTNVNDPPIALEDELFLELKVDSVLHIILNEIFLEIDSNDSLTYTGDLPSWLMLDNAELFGVPSISDIGNWNFNIQAFDISGESAEISVTLNVLNKESIIETGLEHSQFLIYPVPATDFIRVQSKYLQCEFDVYLFNSNGRMVMEESFNNNSGKYLEIDIRGLTPGQYFILIDTENTPFSVSKIFVK